MTAVVIIQARAGSTRLPGKVLLPVAGRPLLGFMLERLRPVQDAGITIVVATSTLDRDDPVARSATDVGVAVVRGDEADVLRRFVDTVQAHPADTVVRLTADCPLIVSDLVLTCVDRHRSARVAYTSNTLARTYPDGLDVEVLDTAVLLEADAHARGDEREHVTPWVQRHPRRFRIQQVVGPEPLGDERWTVDVAEDLRVVQQIVGQMVDPIVGGIDDLLEVTGRRADHTALWAEPDGSIRHHDGTAYLRRWHVRFGDRTIGSAEVEVDDGGAGLWSLQVPDDQRPAARSLIDQLLAADRQVATLAARSGPTEENP